MWVSDASVAPVFLIRATRRLSWDTTRRPTGEEKNRSRSAGLLRNAALIITLELVVKRPG